jgi:hypothetical protein
MNWQRAHGELAVTNLHANRAIKITPPYRKRIARDVWEVVEFHIITGGKQLHFWEFL